METDFLIIGGGIAGLSLAAELAPLGSLTLCEAEDNLGYHASSRSAAMFEPGYGPAPIQALSRASAAAFHASGTLSPRGFMLIAGPGQDAQFTRDLAALRLSEIPRDEALRRVPILNPDWLSRAAISEEACDIDTDALLQGYARTARAAGAQIRTRLPVTALHRAGDLWQVTAGGETLSARIIINAAGAWADEIAALAGAAPIGLQPRRRSMARLPAPEGHDVSRWPMFLAAGETFYAKPDAGALIVSPAEADPVPPHDAYADDMVLAEGLARFEEAVTTPVTRLLANWAGLRSFAPDGVPAIGFDPAVAGFFWLAGQGGYGFQSAPAAAQLAASLLGSGAPLPVDAATVCALDPARFSGKPAPDTT